MPEPIHTPGSGPKPRRGMKIAESIARELATEIASGQLEPGTRLPPEKVMAEQYAVGRTTVREALRLLETRGVLQIRAGPSGGPIVQRPDISQLSESLSLLLQVEKATFAQVLEARLMIEPTVSRLAAERIGDDEIEELREINRLMVDEGAASLDNYFDYNYQFHRGLIDASKSIVIQILAATLMALADSRILGIRYSHKTQLATAKAHDKIIKALAKHDGDAAEQAMKDHLGEVLPNWTRKYGELVNRPVSWIQ